LPQINPNPVSRPLGMSWEETKAVTKPTGAPKPLSPLHDVRDPTSWFTWVEFAWISPIVIAFLVAAAFRAPW
jgi:hypothetical protein